MTTTRHNDAAVAAAARYPAFKHTGTPMGKGFGRIPAVDPRDRGYLIRRPTTYTPSRGNRYWHAGPILDQGDTPQCVAYAGQAFLTAGPVTNKLFNDTPTLYKLCQQNDEWEGEDYDGTSTRGLMKVLQQAGYIGEYNWAFDAQTALMFVLEHGPFLFGTDWYDGMFATDARGFVHVEGAIAGGHEYLCIGASTTRRCPDGSIGAFRCQNSWGQWGQGGRLWLAFNDADRLIKNYGECAMALELKFQERAPEGTESDRPEPPEQSRLHL